MKRKQRLAHWRATRGTRHNGNRTGRVTQRTPRPRR